MQILDITLEPVQSITMLLLLVIIGFLFLNHLKLKSIMATIEQFEEALQRIDNATNEIAADIQALKDQISGQGLPADVENSVLDRLNTIATKLEGIGASVENPVPDEGGGDNGGEGNEGDGNNNG